jgi:phosphatidylinositol-3-phosphatase
MLPTFFRAVRTVAGSLLIGTMLAACNGGSATPTAPHVTTSSIRHVFVIMLENKSYTETFAAGSAAPYLATTLPAQGVLLNQYYGTGHVSLDNYLSFIAGQSPTNETDNDCTTGFNTIAPGTAGASGQISGSGCVYPASVQTLADQLTAAGFTWKGYMGDMGNDPTRESATCGHPAIGTIDMTQTAEAPSGTAPLGDAYATRHDPFMYFHSIIDSPQCANVVNLTNLTNDLKSAAATPNFTFITPNLCDDGHDNPCAIDGKPGGLNRINAFLQTWVPQITSSPAYQKDGLLLITFDESDITSSNVSGSTETLAWSGATCCGQQEGPNLGAFPQTSVISSGSLTINLTKTSFGGDLVGAVVLSPFAKPGSVSSQPYNHYSALASIEDIFGLSHLGYAGASGLSEFGTDVYTSPKQ